MKKFIKPLLLLMLLSSVKAFSQPKLNSHPAAIATIFLDFDGHTVTSSSWNNGVPFVAAPPPLTETQMTEIFNRVSEDYRPFEVNITTDSTKFLSAPLNRRIRIIVTPTSAWSPGVGGIAYIGSFTWGDDTPAFVFSDRLNNSPKYIGECVTHESGHAVGLAHQSSYDNNCNLVEQYALGSGSGETGWAPVMGNSYYKNMTGWNDGPTPYGCASTQDNLTIITTQNGFGYRTDDYSETRNNNTTTLASAFTVNGVISTNTDKDAFKYVISGSSAIHLEITPFGLNSANAGANLDTRIDIYNNSGALINTYNPVNKMNVVIDTTLNSGSYYFVVSGAGNLNTDNYGSLGAYTFTGFRGALPIHNVALSGVNDNNKHSLSWSIIADEPIRTQEIEVSTDGTTYRTLTSVAPANNTFSYQPLIAGTYYYRLKVTSVIDEVAYSNTIILRSNGDTKNTFIVSTLVQQHITVNASAAFDYLLADANGRMLRKGKGNNGVNRIDVSHLPSGLYIIRIISKDNNQTERIIKQ